VYIAIISCDTLEFDVLVTNPPYSGDHKVKLLQFISSRPNMHFALLLPVYTVTKSYWQSFIADLDNSSRHHSGDFASPSCDPPVSIEAFATTAQLSYLYRR
jgi:hypothetical protein